MSILSRVSSALLGPFIGVVAGAIYIGFFLARIWHNVYHVFAQPVLAISSALILSSLAIFPAIAIGGMIALIYAKRGITPGWPGILNYTHHLVNDSQHPFNYATPAQSFSWQGFNSTPFTRSNKSLEIEISTLPHADPIKFLTPLELKNLTACLPFLSPSTAKQIHHRLLSYRQYLQDRCAISLTDMSDINEPITIEANYPQGVGKPSRAYIYTFEREDLLKHIAASENKFAVVPQNNRDLLADRKHIKIYRGFAREATSFIEYVRHTSARYARLRFTSKPLVEPGIRKTSVYLAKNLRKFRLFQSEQASQQPRHVFSYTATWRPRR